MPETNPTIGLTPQNRDEGKAAKLAERAVSLLAGQTRPARGPDALPGLISAMASAALDDEIDARDDLVTRLTARGISTDQIVDHLVPEAARRLGEMWVDDKLGFADVTIGVARLQALLREIGRRANTLGPAQNMSAPHVAMVVRDGETHMLGALIAADQLHRMGAAVCMVLGKTDADVASYCAERSFDAVMISASAGESLETIRKLVKKIRVGGSADCPIILGGSIATQPQDVRDATGVDHVTMDPEEALRLCGLTTSISGASLAPQAH